MCDRTLEHGPLGCIRTDSHDSRHVYLSQSGSWVQDSMRTGATGDRPSGPLGKQLSL